MPSLSTRASEQHVSHRTRNLAETVQLTHASKNLRRKSQDEFPEEGLLTTHYFEFLVRSASSNPPLLPGTQPFPPRPVLESILSLTPHTYLFGRKPRSSRALKSPDHISVDNRASSRISQKRTYNTTSITTAHRSSRLCFRTGIAPATYLFLASQATFRESRARS